MSSDFIKAYHWRTLDTSTWAKQWLTERLVGLQTPNGVACTEVSDVTGDSEVGMRKAKLITIYDLRVETKWHDEARNSKGTLIAIEVSHDMQESEYVFESTLESGGDPASQNEARKQLADLMRPIFSEYPKAMLEIHGATFYQATGVSQGGTPSGTPGTSTPLPTTNTSTTNTTSSDQTSKINVSTVRTEAQFMASAEDIWSLFTDESKIPMWSRNPATMRPTPGSDMSLFGGNITGRVVSVKKPEQLVTTWRAPTWPPQHFGEMTINIEQGSDSTKVSFELTGCPVGQVEDTERNLEIFYVRSLKQMGSVSSSSSSSFNSTTPHGRATTSHRRTRSESPPDFPTPIIPPNKISLFITGAIPVLISLGLMGSLAAAIWYGPTGDTWRNSK